MSNYYIYILYISGYSEEFYWPYFLSLSVERKLCKHLCKYFDHVSPFFNFIEQCTLGVFLDYKLPAQVQQAMITFNKYTPNNKVMCNQISVFTRF